MNLGIFKIIKSGLIGAGGLSVVAIASSEQVREFIGIYNSSYLINRQYQFLYKLSKTIFDNLKNKNPSTIDERTKAVTQGDLISWLASEFEKSNHSTEDNWQNFKSLCEAQKLKENKTPTKPDGLDNVKVPASRVCYMDKGRGYSESEPKYEKGYLGLWGLPSAGTGYNGFEGWNWSNLQLWEYFNHHHPNQSPLDKFNDWYLTQTISDTTDKISEIKTILERK